MVSDYLYSKANFKVPDQPTKPPELSDEEWEKNNRNSIRADAIGYLGVVISRLDELDHDGYYRKTQHYLMSIQDYLEGDMED